MFKKYDPRLTNQDRIDYYSGELKRHMRLYKFSNNKSQKSHSMRDIKYNARMLWKIVNSIIDNKLDLSWCSNKKLN